MSAPTVETAGVETACVEPAATETAATETAGVEPAAMEAVATEVGAKASTKAAMKAESVAEPEWKVAPVIGIVVVVAER